MDAVRQRCLRKPRFVSPRLSSLIAHAEIRRRNTDMFFGTKCEANTLHHVHLSQSLRLPTEPSDSLNLCLHSQKLFHVFVCQKNLFVTHQSVNMVTIFFLRLPLLVLYHDVWALRRFSCWSQRRFWSHH